MARELGIELSIGGEGMGGKKHFFRGGRRSSLRN